MGRRQVELKLIYDGKDITLDIWQFVENFRYVDRTLPDKMDELSLTLQDVAGLWRSRWFPQVGAKFNAAIKASDWFNVGDNFERDCGGFEIDDLTSSGMPSTFTISAVSVGISSSIRRQQNTRAWESVDIKTIADDVATKHGFELQFYSDYNPVLERWEQKSRSDLAFLKDVVEYAGMMLKITNEYLIVYRGEEFDKKKPEVKIRMSGDGVKSWSFNSNSSDVYSACEVKYYDPAKKELLEFLYVPDGISGVRNSGGSRQSRPTSKQVINRDTRMVETVEIPQPMGDAPTEITEPEVGQILKVNRRMESLAEAQEVAKAALRNTNMHQMTGNIVLMGRPDLYSGMTVNVEGFGLWDSIIWSVEEVAHDYSRSGYTSTVQIRGILGY
jgi:phage protein D